MYFELKSNAVIKSTTITGNIAGSFNGIYLADDSSMSLVNSILWENDITGSLQITYSDIKGSYNGDGNIDTEKLLGQIAELLQANNCNIYEMKAYHTLLEKEIK